MITFNIGNLKYDCPSDWSEVTLRKFYNVMQLSEKKKDIKSELEFTLDFIKILCDIPKDILYELKTDSYVKLTNSLDWISTEPKGEEIDIITINEQTYCFPKDLNNLTMGESISVEMAIKDANGSVSESFINMLPILLRPCKEVTNVELDKKEWEQEPLDTKNLAERKEIFLDNLMVTEVIKFRDFFFNGDEASSIISKDTLEKMKQ